MVSNTLYALRSFSDRFDDYIAGTYTADVPPHFPPHFTHTYNLNRHLARPCIFKAEKSVIR